MQAMSGRGSPGRKSETTPDALFSAEQRQRIRRRLRSWYRREGRDLPWRRTGDPYRIWVSEIMLQQTTVAAVVPFYERFFEALPTLADLAEADEATVLRLWEGLGYYSRARNLRRAAIEVVDRFGGTLPRELVDLQSLPGIGRYTAGAIRSFGFDLPAPIVEANTERLFSRLVAYDQPLTTAAGKRVLWQAAEELVPRTKPGEFNQAVMELGSQVCRVRDPLCERCPLATDCRAFQTDRTSSIPVAKARPAITEVTEVALAIFQGERVLMRRRAEGERWAGMWDFPRYEVADISWLPAMSGNRQPVLPGIFSPLEALAAERFGLEVSIDQWLAELNHGVTRYRIRLLCLGGTLRQDFVGHEEWRWVVPSDVDGDPLTRTARQLMNQLAADAAK